MTRANAMMRTAARLTRAAAVSGSLQRKCACAGHTGLDGECEDCRKEKLQQSGHFPGNAGQTLKRRAKTGAEHSEIPSIVHAVLRSPGDSLDPITQQRMERRFGHDFSRIRVHADAQAAESARAVDALAYTVGNHIVFESGKFSPATVEGNRLLVHELVHAIQQDSAPESPPRSIESNNSAAEQEAARAESDATAAVSGQHGGILQRQQQPAAGGTPTLTYTKSAPLPGECGDFWWQIKWKLDGANQQTNGFIVQKVKSVSIAEKCDGTKDDAFDVWWEAFQVKSGKIMSGISNSESLGDEFSWTGTNGSKGMVYVAGSAKFMENYTEPLQWKRLKQAGSLPATTTQPAGWKESGSKYRYIGSSDYSCCDPHHKTAGKITTEELDV